MSLSNKISLFFIGLIFLTGCSGKLAFSELNVTTELDSSWAPQWANIVGVWHLNEAANTSGTGSVKDSSGNGYSATPSNVTFGVSTPFATGASFNGTSSYLLNSTTINTSQVTVSAWVKISAYSDPGIGKGYLVGFAEGNGSPITDKVLTVDPYGMVRFYVYNQSEFITSTPTVAMALNTWNHIVGVVDGTNTYAYLNGDQVGMVANGASYTSYRSGGNILIGGRVNSHGAYLAADIDEVAIWSTGLSAQEVKFVYVRQSTSK